MQKSPFSRKISVEGKPKECVDHDCCSTELDHMPAPVISKLDQYFFARPPTTEIQFPFVSWRMTVNPRKHSVATSPDGVIWCPLLAMQVLYLPPDRRDQYGWLLPTLLLPSLYPGETQCSSQENTQNWLQLILIPRPIPPLPPAPFCSIYRSGWAIVVFSTAYTVTCVDTPHAAKWKHYSFAPKFGQHRSSTTLRL